MTSQWNHNNITPVSSQNYIIVRSVWAFLFDLTVISSWCHKYDVMVWDHCEFIMISYNEVTMLDHCEHIVSLLVWPHRKRLWWGHSVWSLWDHHELAIWSHRRWVQADVTVISYVMISQCESFVMSQWPWHYLISWLGNGTPFCNPMHHIIISDSGKIYIFTS